MKMGPFVGLVAWYLHGAKKFELFGYWVLECCGFLIYECDDAW